MTDNVQIGADDLLALIGWNAGLIAEAVKHPSALNTEGLLRVIAKQYSLAEKLHEIAMANAKAQSEEAKAN